MRGVEFGKVVQKEKTYDERTTGDLVDSKPLLRIAILKGSKLLLMVADANLPC